MEGEEAFCISGGSGGGIILDHLREHQTDMKLLQ